MTYADAIAFWYGLIDYERRAPKPGDLKLDRMRELLRRLGDPHEGLRVVHLAGTKGKGSTAAMLEAVLRRAGCRTGLSTSPHLSAVEERIEIDGVPIGRDELAARMAEVAPAVEGMRRAAPAGQAPTFFEVGTALGFLHFRRRAVEVAVVEVGLGGRFDSTNVCTPLVSVITNLSFDHTAQLGPRLANIAREKAGIIKPGRPVVCTATAPDGVAVIEEAARERGSPLLRLGRDFHYGYEPARIDGGPDRRPRVRVRTRERAWPWTELGLIGEHQAENAAGAVQAVECLRAAGLPVADTAVCEGLSQVRWPARLEVMGHRPLVVLDCAHNVASASALVEALGANFVVPGRRLLIFAVSGDKDVPGMLRVLAPHFDRAFVTAYANNPRVVPPADLARGLRDAAPELPVSVHERSEEAWAAAREAAGPDDLIAVTGSVFLAGELRPLLVKQLGPC